MMKMKLSYEKKRDYEAERSELTKSRRQMVDEYKQTVNAILKDQNMSLDEKKLEVKVQNTMLQENDRQFQEALRNLNAEEARTRMEQAIYENDEENTCGSFIDEEAGPDHTSQGAEAYCSFADEQTGQQTDVQDAEDYCSFTDNSSTVDQKADSQQDMGCSY